MTVETSPTARALRALEVLQARPGVSAGDLGTALGVTERAARRYVAILREAGIPVHSERGPYGGYRLGRGMRLPPVVFTETEALALVMAVIDSSPPAVVAGVAGTGDPAGEADGPVDVVGSALDKVVRALPEAVGRQADALRQHASAAPRPASPRPDPATTSALVGAIASRRPVCCTYRSASGRHHRVELDPWAVVVRYGRWYLLCHSHHAGAPRTYRIDRLDEVEPGTGPVEPPEDLDPVAFLEESLGSGWGLPTRVEFAAPQDAVAPWIRPAMGRLEPLGEDRCVLVGSTSNPAMYVQEWLAAVPFAFRVVEGPELRAAVRALVDRLTAAVREDD